MIATGGVEHSVGVQEVHHGEGMKFFAERATSANTRWLIRVSFVTYVRFSPLVTLSSALIAAAKWHGSR